jgi:lysophospholipase L1-like esterase
VKLVAEYNRTYYEMKWLEEIEREEFMRTRIRAKKPDLIIVGVGHYDGIKKACNCRPIYRDRFVPSDFRRTYDRMIAERKRARERMRTRMQALPKPRKRRLRHIK